MGTASVINSIYLSYLCVCGTIWHTFDGLDLNFRYVHVQKFWKYGINELNGALDGWSWGH